MRRCFTGTRRRTGIVSSPIIWAETFGVPEEETLAAIGAGDAAQETFERVLKRGGEAVLDMVRREGKFAVVLASRRTRTMCW